MIVTRGDVDLAPCLSHIEVDTVVIVRGTVGVWERYQTVIERVPSGLVYTQDDDCVVDAAQVIEQYEPGKVVCNMPQAKRAEYPDGVALVGWGAVFEAAAPLMPFASYRARFPEDELFRRECDRVFTGLSELKLIDVPFTHLPHAHAANRMGMERNHLADLAAIRERIYACR